MIRVTSKLSSGGEKHYESLPEEKLAAHVLMALVEDIESLEFYMRMGFPKKKKTNEARITRTKRDGYDAVMCLFYNSKMVEFWASAAQINIDLFRRHVKTKYPILCGGINGPSY